MKKALTIAGSDCSGGAGIQADLKTFSAHGVYGMSVIVSVVAENTSRVIDIQDISPDIIRKQMEAVFEDIEVDAVKIGMLSKRECMQAVSVKLKQYKPANVVIDPVMLAKGGHALMQEDALSFFISELIPFADMLTPNIPEAEAITGLKIFTTEDMKKAAEIIYSMGAKSVLVKGGHLEGDAEDILFNGKSFNSYTTKRINTKNTHGTGCTFSSAIAANLALGMDYIAAVRKAKEYVTMAIEHSLDIGKGHGPTNHFYNIYLNGLTKPPASKSGS
ncbi:MAG: bifunctional hydroxymethylpyrimidine kinase/phosphomethylpyrimidine kinase [Ruminiclostridium sp.]